MLERKTTISSNVLSTLEGASYPLSVSQIRDQLREKGLSPNKTTIYRILEKLTASQAISEVTVRNGATFYEFKTGRHHHHFICNACDGVICLDSCHVNTLHINLQQLLPNPNFKIQSHDFNLYGICEPCAANREEMA